HRGHPTGAMVARVLEEYRLADHIRVSSTWAMASTAKELANPTKISIVDQPLDLSRFRPPRARQASTDLHVVYVGSIDVRKGVLRLLRAVRMANFSAPVRITLVGGTGSRGMHSALRRETAGLNVVVAPGDPVPAYHAADVLVLPTLEDGFGFVVAEAMACALPVVVTDQSGAAEWVREAAAGWVVPAADEKALESALDDAIVNKAQLRMMGVRGRDYVDVRAGDRCFAALQALVGSVTN
ncbi:MAG TPA: glycosyltransferase family 4 protein, partial [Gemmatimonadaceae bacterium]